MRFLGGVGDLEKKVSCKPQIKISCNCESPSSGFLCFGTWRCVKKKPDCEAHETQQKFAKPLFFERPFTAPNSYQYQIPPYNING